MTGEKNRGVSLEKLWNLDDKQLTTPKHDELVLSATKQYIVCLLTPDLRFKEAFEDQGVKVICP